MAADQIHASRDGPAVLLPAQAGPLVGRAADVALARERLLSDDVRLLTLVGPAGTGKTRLAIAVAHLAADAFSDGAAFVDLSPLTDPDLVDSAIAQVLMVRERLDLPLLEVLKAHLAGRQVLLVLDNFEQLLPAARRLVELLQVCPQLKLLVTSRSALHVSWEHEMPVPPLAVPRLDRLPAPEALIEVASVALFIQRTQRVDPDFRLTQANAAAVAEICVRLDGLPLAIELAAARARVLQPQALLSRLDGRLSLLAGGGQDQPARERTLRAALDWSYELLPPPEQLLFRRLGVFVGGFALEAVPEVCDPQGELGFDPLVVVESLVDKSLVRQNRGDAAEPRFSLLETIRDYALERLAESNEQHAVRRRHAAYYLSGADFALAQIGLSQQAVWLHSLELEHDNLRAALAWCQESREPEPGLRAAGLLAWFWTVRGHLSEGRARLAGLLGIADSSTPGLRADALRVAGSLALEQFDYAAARGLFVESLAIRRQLGHSADMLGALTGLGLTATQQGDDAIAQACFEEALAIQRALGDPVGIAESLNNLANLAYGRGNLAAARALYEQSEVLTREVGYRVDVPQHNLGVVAHEQGDLVTARRQFEQSAAMKRALGDAPGLALSLAKLGEVAADIGDLDGAYTALAESLAVERDLGDRPGIAFVLERFAMVAAAHDRPEQALRLAGASSALRDAIGAPLQPAALASLEARLAPARKTLGPSVANSLWQQGRAMSFEEAVASAPVPREPERPAAVSGAHEPHPALAVLTPRERQVAALVARGLTNKQIAAELVVSDRTADVHVSNILGKLEMTSRSQLAVWAVTHGLPGVRFPT